MLKASLALQRYRTAWRELLHPLPVASRHDQWLKRDTIEMNEAILRRPYYTLKSYSQTAVVDRSSGALASSEPATSSCTHDPCYTMIETLKKRHVRSAEQLLALRGLIQVPGAVGPPLPPQKDNSTYVEEYGPRLRPRYPSSWDTVAPQQPSRLDF